MQTPIPVRAVLLATALSSLALAGCSTDSGSGNDPLQDMAMTPDPDLSIGIPTGKPTVLTGFQQPASAFFDATSNAWYISNVITGNVNDPRGFDDKMAFISKVPADLSAPDHVWYKPAAAAGFSAPFGLRIVSGKLYVGDINKLWSIDVANPTGAATFKTGTVAAAGLAGLAGYPAFLIDVALDSAGNVYAVDATGGRLLKWAAPFSAASTPTTLITADTLAGPSGIYLDTATMKVLISEAGVMQLGKMGGVTSCNLDGSMRSRLFNASVSQLAYQGIEKDGTKYMLASPAGKAIYTFDTSGSQPALLHNVGSEGATTATDIGWDPASRTLAVPDTGANVVYFYKIPS